MSVVFFVSVRTLVEAKSLLRKEQTILSLKLTGLGVNWSGPVFECRYSMTLASHEEPLRRSGSSILTGKVKKWPC